MSHFLPTLNKIMHNSFVDAFSNPKNQQHNESQLLGERDSSPGGISVYENSCQGDDVVITISTPTNVRRRLGEKIPQSRLVSFLSHFSQTLNKIMYNSCVDAFSNPKNQLQNESRVLEEKGSAPSMTSIYQGVDVVLRISTPTNVRQRIVEKKSQSTLVCLEYLVAFLTGIE